MTDGEMKMYRAREEVKAVLELEAKVFNETVGSVKPALQFLMTRIGSWTNARWDQHLRDQFGMRKLTL